MEFMMEISPRKRALHESWYFAVFLQRYDVANIFNLVLYRKNVKQQQAQQAQQTQQAQQAHQEQQVSK